MQNVLSGTISVDQYSSSIGTVWKSSSSLDDSSSSEGSGIASLELSEVSMHTGEVLRSWSLLKERWQCTGLVGVCVRLLDVVTGLCGVVCAGLKDACSMLDTWCMHGILCEDVGKSSLEPLS